MPLKGKLPTNKLSLLVFCPQDKSFLLLFDEDRGDYWIPCTDMDEKLSWKENLKRFKKELIDCDIDNEKLLRIYKIWNLRKEVLHLIIQINIPKEVKGNNNTRTSIGIIQWCSCSELSALRPLLRSLEILEIVNIYKPLIKGKSQEVNGETLPLGNLVEINKNDLLIDLGNCKDVPNLDLLESAAMSSSGFIFINPAQCELYEEYFMYTYPCIYMNCVSFHYAMQQYELCEDILRLFQAADVHNRNFLTFQDFLFLFAVMNPLTAHYGNLAEVRCQYIFRYYNENRDGKLSFLDLKNLITDIELKKNCRITEKELDKLFEKLAKSLNLKPSTLMMFDQFFNLVLKSKIRDTSYLLRFKENFLNNLSLELCDSVQKLCPAEFILSSRCKCFYEDRYPSYSVALNTTVLRQKESPFIMRDMRLFEDTMTRSVSEELQLFEDLNIEAISLEEKIDDLFFALKYFSSEIHEAQYCFGEYEIEDKSAYSWGSLDLNKVAINFIIICEKVIEILRTEPRLLEINPPVYVMGDLHGNYHDLMCFEKTLWINGLALTPAKMLFLGDYVDRGNNGVEILMYLFANKIKNPKKLYLIRGNHEVREVQVLFTFHRECYNKFGEIMGTAVWKAVNNVFDVLPLAAIIDHKVFCCHGGIPPPWLCPIVSVINSIPNPLVECEKQSPLAWTLMWNDPMKSRCTKNSFQQMELLANEGFLPNFQRGTGFCFSCDALNNFLLRNNLSHVIRAHEVVKSGFQIHQKTKLLTVFSTSNYCGGKNYAGAVLVGDNLLRVCAIDTGHRR